MKTSIASRFSVLLCTVLLGVQTPLYIAAVGKGYRSISSITAFKKDIASAKPTVVKFSASWCGPCKQMAPAYSAIAQEYPNVTFLEVDNDKKSVASLFNEYGVRGMPTIIYFHKGREIFRDRKGALTKNELNASVKRLLSTAQSAQKSATPKKATGAATIKKQAPTAKPAIQKKTGKKSPVQKVATPVKKTVKKPIRKKAVVTKCAPAPVVRCL